MLKSVEILACVSAVYVLLNLISIAVGFLWQWQGQVFLVHADFFQFCQTEHLAASCALALRLKAIILLQQPLIHSEPLSTIATLYFLTISL